MAVEFMGVVKPIFAGLDSANPPDLIIAALIIAALDELEEQDIDSVGTLIDNNTRWPPIPGSSDPQTKFLERLTRDVFEPALELRVTMEMYGFGEYQFLLLSEGKPLNFQSHTAIDARNNAEIPKAKLCREDGFELDVQQREGRSPDRRIKLALFPRLEAKFKAKKGGEWSKVKHVVRAYVLLWQKENETVQEAQTTQLD